MQDPRYSAVGARLAGEATRLPQSGSYRVSMFDLARRIARKAGSYSTPARRAPTVVLLRVGRRCVGNGCFLLVLERDLFVRGLVCEYGSHELVIQVMSGLVGLELAD